MNLKALLEEYFTFARDYRFANLRPQDALYHILNVHYFDSDKPLSWNLESRQSLEDMEFYVRGIGFDFIPNTSGDYYHLHITHPTLSINDNDLRLPTYTEAFSIACLLIILSLLHNYKPKSDEDIATLKGNWNSDPCWDIETTEGFERHYLELYAYRKKKESQWEEEYQEKVKRQAARYGIPDNLTLTQHLLNLERRLETLENNQSR